MGTILQIAFGICLIFLVGNLIASGIHTGTILQTVTGACLIIFTGGMATYMNNRKRSGSKNNGIEPDRAEKIEARLDDQEQRLTDIQDIVISIDDQLKRTARRPDLSADKTTDDLLQ